MKPSKILSCFTPIFCVLTASTVHAATITKTGTSTDLNAGASWSGGSVPGAGDVATWNSSSLGAGLTAASAASWGSIDITGALTNIGIAGAGTITTGNITLAGNRTLTIANNIALSGNSTYTVADVTSSTATDATLGAISGAFGITKTGAGTLTLSGTNTFTGSINVNQGTLTSTGGALTGPLGTTSGAVNIASGATLNLSGLGNNQLETTGTITIGGTLAATTNVANSVRGKTINLDNGGTLTSTVTNTSGYGAFFVNTIGGANTTITAKGGGNVISGTGVIGIQSGATLTLDTALSGDTLSVIGTIGQGANGTAGALTKTGAGTVTFTGANTYSGTTTINGGTLDLGGGTSTGSINGATGTALVLGGGKLNYTRTGNTTQNFTGTTLNAGASAVTVVDGNTVNLGAITRNAGGTVDFGTTGSIITSTTNTNGILGVATFGGTTWAVGNGAGAITGLASYTTTTTAGTTAASYLNNNIDVDGSVAPVAAITPNSLRFNTAAANTLTLTGTNIISSGGILVNGTVGNNLSTITGGTLQGASGKDLVVIQNNTANNLTIGSLIANNGGATGLTKFGAGTLVLNNTGNSYTGATNVNAGTLIMQAPTNAAWTTPQGTKTVFNSATLKLEFQSATTTFQPTNIGAIVVNSGGILELNGTRTTIDHNYINGGSITGTGKIIKTGSGYVDIFNGSSIKDFAGDIDIQAGTLATNNADWGSSAGLMNVNVGAGATLDLRVGNVKINKLDGAATTSSIIGTSAPGTLTVGSNNGSSTFAGVISNGIALTKTGTGTQTLTNTNSYTGGTIINGGTLTLGHATNTLANTGAVNVDGATAVLNIGSNSDTVGAVSLKNGGSITGIGGTLTGTSYAVENGSVSAILGGTNVVLNKTTAGIATLTGANTYTGLTTVSAGELRLNNTGGQSIAGDLTVSGGTAKLLQVSQINSTKNLVVSGGTFDIQGNNQTLANVQLTSGGINGSGGTLTSTNAYAMQAGTVSAKLGGGVALNKTTAGIVTLAGANTYTGATIITAGTLALTGTGSIDDSSGVSLGTVGTFDVSGRSGGAYTVNNLSGSGTVVGALTVSSSLAIGNSPGTVTFDGNLTLGAGSTSDFEISSDGYEAGTYDLAQGGAGSQTVTFDGVLNLLFNGSENYANNSTVQIFNFENYSGAFDSVNFSGLGAGQTATFNANTGLVTVVPEPAAALLGGLGLLALLRRRR